MKRIAVIFGAFLVRFRYRCSDSPDRFRARPGAGAWAAREWNRLLRNVASKSTRRRFANCSRRSCGFRRHPVQRRGEAVCAVMAGVPANREATSVYGLRHALLLVCAGQLPDLGRTRPVYPAAHSNGASMARSHRAIEPSTWMAGRIRRPRPRTPSQDFRRESTRATS